MPANTPRVNKHVRVEIQGLEDLGGWFYASDQDDQTEAKRIDGQHGSPTRWIEGQRTIAPITLKRYFDGDERLKQWRLKGSKELRDGSIITMDDDGKELSRASWGRGWCCRRRVSAIDASAPATPIVEEIEIVVEGLG